MGIPQAYFSCNNAHRLGICCQWNDSRIKTQGKFTGRISAQSATPVEPKELSHVAYALIAHAIIEQSWLHNMLALAAIGYYCDRDDSRTPLFLVRRGFGSTPDCRWADVLGEPSDRPLSDPRCLMFCDNSRKSWSESPPLR